MALPGVETERAGMRFGVTGEMIEPEWVRREGGIEWRMVEVNKKDYSTGGGQIMIEGRRVVGEREKDPMCLLPAASASACKISNLISERIHVSIIH